MALKLFVVDFEISAQKFILRSNFIDSLIQC